MSAQDYQVGSAPYGVSYAAPLVGMQLGQAIGNLPKDYFDATQRARTREMQKPILDPVTGQPSTDVGTMQKELLRRGGGEYAEKLMPLLMGTQVGQQQAQNLHDLEKYAQGGEGAPARPGGSAAGPGNLTQQPQRSQPQLSSAGTDNQGATSLASLASETGVDLGSILPRIAQSLGINHPADPLTPEQAQQARAALTNAAKLWRSRGTQPGASDTNQPAQAASAPPQAGGAAGAPQMPTGGVSGSPAPAGGGPETAMPASGIRPQGYPQQGEPQQAARPQAASQAGQIPTDPIVQRYRSASNHAMEMAIQYAAIPNGGGAVAAGIAKDNSAMYEARAKAREDFLFENAKKTPAQKDAEASNVKGGPLQYEKVKKQNDDDTVRYGKQLASIQGSAGAANRMLEYTQLAKGILKDQNVHFGTAEGLNLALKKFKNLWDPNNTESLAQEAYRKVTAASVLSQVEQLKDDTAAVGGGGRLFQQQVALMEKAAGDPTNTVHALRLLTEVAERSAKMSKTIAQMANKYNGGHLDANFAQSVDDYYTKHPMFTPAEMKDIRLIAPLEFNSDAEVGKAGLPKGHPIKVKGEWHKAL